MWPRAAPGEAAQDFGTTLAKLGELQRADFMDILRAMRGLPVTIRLLDPPIHEFVDIRRFEQELSEAERGGGEAASPSCSSIAFW